MASIGHLLLHAHDVLAQAVELGRLTLRIAALHGVGVAQLPTMMVRDDLAAGRPVNLLRQWRPVPAVVHLVLAAGGAAPDGLPGRGVCAAGQGGAGGRRGGG